MKVRLIGILLFLVSLVFGPDRLAAQNLGSGRSPEIATGWIVIMLILCLGIAALAIFWIKLRHDRGAAPVSNWLRRSGRKSGLEAFQIVETRRAGSQTDVTLVRWRGREFLLAISAGQLLLLGEQESEMGSVLRGEES